MNNGKFSGGYQKSYSNKNGFTPNTPAAPVSNPVVINSENYVDVAEDIVKNKLKRNKNGDFELTTSKIRNILAMVSELYDTVVHEPGEKLSMEIVERIQYLRLRIAYEAGREPAVKDFVLMSDLLGQVKKIKDSKKALLLFCKYMEALVAFRKFYGKKDE